MNLHLIGSVLIIAGVIGTNVKQQTRKGSLVPRIQS
jgi:hypothetical protein